MVIKKKPVKSKGKQRLHQRLCNGAYGGRYCWCGKVHMGYTGSYLLPPKKTAVKAKAGCKKKPARSDSVGKKAVSETKMDIIKDIKEKTKHLKPHAKGEFNKVLNRADKGELECIRKHCKTSPDGSQVYTGLIGKY